MKNTTDYTTSIKKAIKYWTKCKSIQQHGDSLYICPLCDLAMDITIGIKKEGFHVPLCKSCIVTCYSKTDLCSNIGKLVDESFFKHSDKEKITKRFKVLKKQILNMGDDLLKRIDIDFYKEWLKTLLDEPQYNYRHRSPNGKKGITNNST